MSDQPNDNPPPPANLGADDLGSATTVVGAGAAKATCPSRLGANPPCELGAGHEDKDHPDHLVDQWGEILHRNAFASWPVDPAGCRERIEARKKARLEMHKKKAADIREG